MSAPGTDWLLADGLAPATGGHLAPLYQGAEAGQLVMPFCSSCATPMELEQVRCDRCGAPVTWRAVEPSGVVHAATTVHRREPGLVRCDGPYHVVDVELHSGHRIVMTTSAPSDRAPDIGEPVAVVFRRVGTVAVPSVHVAAYQEPHVASDQDNPPEVDG